MLKTISSCSQPLARRTVLKAGLGGARCFLVNRLPGLLCQFKPDGLSSFLLTHRRALNCMSIWGNILDLEDDDLAPPAACYR
jgi:hypothetical protein